MAFRENIKRLRESRGLTQSRLGDAIGVTGKAVSTWESGTRMPRMNAVDKLAAFFGIDKRDLLFEASCANAEPAGGRGGDEVTRKLLDFAATATDDELRQLIDYIAFIKSRRSGQ